MGRSPPPMFFFGAPLSWGLALGKVYFVFKSCNYWQHALNPGFLSNLNGCLTGSSQAHGLYRNSVVPAGGGTGLLWWRDMRACSKRCGSHCSVQVYTWRPAAYARHHHGQVEFSSWLSARHCHSFPAHLSRTATLCWPSSSLLQVCV